MVGFALSSEKFQGPLEVLLDLIEARKMLVSDVSLAEVCDSYLAYVEQLPELPLSETSQFILVASTLLLIKSRSLLPTLELSNDERESVEELERRLARLRVVRQATKALRSVWGTAPLALPRKAPERSPLFSPGETTVDTVLLAVRRIIASIPVPERLAEAKVAPVIALSEVIRDLKTRLSRVARARWSDLTHGADRHGRIVNFLALLELVRSGSASATQDKLFGDILIEAESAGEVPRYGV